MYKERWEEKEKMNLESDIIMRLENSNKDRKYKEVFEHLDHTEQEKQIEEELALNEEIDLLTIDEDTKSILVSKIRLQILTRQFYMSDHLKTKRQHERELKAKREHELQL